MLDTHTHTIASGHAYNTMKEMIDAAIDKRLDVLCITDHGPAMPGSAHPFYFTNLRAIKKDEYPIGTGNVIFGDAVLKVINGMEANILDYTGRTDYEDIGDDIQNLKYIIASFHKCCCPPGSVKQNTEAYVGAIKKPYVSVVGHIDDGSIPCDYETVVKAAKEYNVLVEVNNSSNAPNSFRLNSPANTLEYLALCKEYNVPVIMNSDAHFYDDIANFSNVLPLLEKVKFPKDLIINYDTEAFLKFVEDKYTKRKKLLGIE